MPLSVYGENVRKRCDPAAKNPGRIGVNELEADSFKAVLKAAGGGDARASRELLVLVYGELRRLARVLLGKVAPGNTLQPTALVHEAYMRLVAQDTPDWESRSHFFGVAAHLMRQILVDHARRHRSQKRGGGATPVPLDEAIAFAPAKSDDILALDEALGALAAIDERKSRVIELRFFGGLTVEETARVLNLSVGTIGREQRLAEAWLHRELASPT